MIVGVEKLFHHVPAVVIARSVSDEAIQSGASDWIASRHFAALAMTTRSRGAPLRPELCHATVTPLLDSSPSGLTRWSMLSCSSKCRWKHSQGAASARMTDGKEWKERKKFGGETPTDARLFCRA